MALLRSLTPHFVRLGFIVTALAWLHLVAGGANLARAQGSADKPTVIRGAFQSEPVAPIRYDGDLREIPKLKAWKPGDPIREIPRLVTPPEVEGIPSQPSQRDPLLELQESTPKATEDPRFSTPILNFEGISFTGALPPDTVGAVGPNHFIQMVNDGAAGGSVFAIYDKAGNILAGPLSLQSLWSAGGPCSSGAGDPIVVYDRPADRWLMSEFADIGNHLCVYISQTPDPVSGGWFLYDFTTPNFPDYPKYGVWPDAYYVSTNEGPGPAVYALDRNQMLGGLPATFQRFTAPQLGAFGFQALIPSNLDGSTPPPAGAPNFFMRHRDDEAHNPGANDPNQDFLEIWELFVDFADPGNSTFIGPMNIPVSEFDSELCGFVSFDCFPQPGTPNRLDPLREVVMHRLQYRNFGTHETLVGNFVTDVDATDHGGIRWFELRKTEGGPWTLFQEGTFAPDEAHRWMGSISMDKEGNTAVGYSVSSGTVFPSIRYAGRLASDPLGTLPQGENTLIDGGASQTVTTRWGDYSAMTVDPVDDCTFWYTTEYIPAGTGGTWRTRIGTFKFDNCAPVVGPDIDVQPSSWNYGNVMVGSSSDRDFAVGNTGTMDLIVSEVNLVGTDAAEFTIAAGGEPFTLAPGGTQIVTVRFAPTSAGAKSASLRFISNDPDENPKDVPLTGTGTTDTGSVDCNTLAGCQVPDKDSFAPAIRFNMTRDDVVHIEAQIFAGLGCTAFVSTVVGDLPLPAGLNAVSILFPDPLPPGTQLSMRWNVGTCAQTDCIDYTIGSSPPLCFAEVASELPCNVPASLIVGAERP